MKSILILLFLSFITITGCKESCEQETCTITSNGEVNCTCCVGGKCECVGDCKCIDENCQCLICCVK